MASIKISDLRPSGFDSFVDSKSFLKNLSDSDLAAINGGRVDDTLVIITNDGTVIIVNY
jgi:bacteriocin-like protein